MSRHSQSIDSKILRRIYGAGMGSVHIPTVLRSREPTRCGLSLASTGEGEGFTPFRPWHLRVSPRTSGVGNVIPRHRQDCARTLRETSHPIAACWSIRNEHARTIQAGSSEGGISHRWAVAPREDSAARIQLRHTSPRNMATAGRLSGMLVQAFRFLGKQHITPARMQHLKRTLPEKERRKLLKDLPLTPTWMHPLFRELAADGL